MPSEFINMLRTIESANYATKYSVISSFRHLVRELRKDDNILMLIRYLDDTNNMELFVSRINEVTNSSIDLNYANPHDIAITSYLLALSVKSEELSLFAAKIVEEKFKNSWWADKISKQILMNNRKVENSESISYTEVITEDPTANEDQIEKSNTPTVITNLIDTKVRIPEFVSGSEDSEKSNVWDLGETVFPNSSIENSLAECSL